MCKKYIMVLGQHSEHFSELYLVCLYLNMKSFNFRLLPSLTCVNFEQVK